MTKGENGASSLCGEEDAQKSMGESGNLIKKAVLEEFSGREKFSGRERDVWFFPEESGGSKKVGGRRRISFARKLRGVLPRGMGETTHHARATFGRRKKKRRDLGSSEGFVAVTR